MTDPLALWDFGDPAGSRKRFEAAALTEPELFRTQVARAYGLEGDFGRGHAILDGLDQGDARVLLERGRLLRSSGDIAGSVPLFRAAFEKGGGGLRADAAHMLALVLPDEHDEWARRGLEAAEGAEEPLAWAMTGALLNNLGWKHAGDGRWQEAYELFDRAVAARQRVAEAVQGKAAAESLHVARWTRARALRELGREDEALAEMTELAMTELGAGDPHVAEELAHLRDG